MVKVLVFDTETTDKPPLLPGDTWNSRESFGQKLLHPNYVSLWKDILDKWPSIIQFSYILYDTENHKDIKLFNKYIDIGNDIVISEGSIAVHHITKEKLAGMPSKDKSNIENVLRIFMEDVKKADVIVGHNVDFDRKMIVAEFLRMIEKYYEKGNGSELEDFVKQIMDKSKFACTMNDTMEVCKLQMKIEYKDKKTGEPKVFYKIKSPKLSESYKHYFGYEPSGEALHDSLADVVLCLRIFIKYKYDKDVCGTNRKITNMIIKMSPEGYTCSSMEGLIEENVELSESDGENDDNENIIKLKRPRRRKQKRASKKRRDYFSWKGKTQRKSRRNKN